MQVIENAVAGKRYVSAGRRVPVFNPATGEQIGRAAAVDASRD